MRYVLTYSIDGWDNVDSVVFDAERLPEDGLPMKEFVREVLTDYGEQDAAGIASEKRYFIKSCEEAEVVK